MGYIGSGAPVAHLDGYNKAQFDAWLSGRNKLDNSCFSVAQRGTTFDSATDYPNNDDAYTLDRWILLSDGNDVFDVSQSTTVANHAPGAQYGIKLEVETAAKKGGILQIIENKKVERLFKNGTGKCSLSFTAHTSDATNMTKIRAAVLAWDSTADTVTSDVVSAWNAEDTNPTLVSNWAYENTPVELTGLTSTPTRYELTDIALDTAGTKNLAVFIWSENTSNGVDDAITITDVQLESGSTCSPFEALEFEDALWECQRFCQVFGEHSVFPGICFNNDPDWYFPVQLVRTMRKAPDFSTKGSPNTILTLDGVGSSGTLNAGAILNNQHVRLEITPSNRGSQGDAGWLQLASASEKLLFSADL